MSSASQRKLDPIAEAHDFALIENGSIYCHAFDDDSVDVLQTEAKVLSAAHVLAELWQPDSWEVEMASYGDDYRNDDLTQFLERVPVELGVDAGIARLRAMHEQFRLNELAEPPWALGVLFGRGRGWLRVALPTSAPLPKTLAAWTADGWSPMDGRVAPGGDVDGISTVWYQPKTHHTECDVMFTIDYPGRAEFELTLGINLLDADLDPRPASAITAAGIPLADWRAAQQRMTRMVLDRLEQQGWSRRER